MQHKFTAVICIFQKCSIPKQDYTSNLKDNISTATNFPDTQVSSYKRTRRYILALARAPTYTLLFLSLVRYPDVSLSPSLHCSLDLIIPGRPYTQARRKAALLRSCTPAARSDSSVCQPKIPRCCYRYTLYLYL